MGDGAVREMILADTAKTPATPKFEKSVGLILLRAASVVEITPDDGRFT